MSITSVFTRWSPRSILLVAFLGCILFATAAEASTNSVAANWQSVKGSLPHEKIPSDPAELKDTSAWAMPYAISIGKIVGLGFAIAFLSLLIGLVYGLVKLFRMCCKKLFCSSDNEDNDSDTDSESDRQVTTWGRIWTPTAIYAVCWVFLLAGVAIGFQGNPQFTKGVNVMGDAVVSVGNGAVELGNGLLDSVDVIVDLIPTTIEGIKLQFSGVIPLADEVVVLSEDVNATSSQVNDITNAIAQIDAGNTSAVADLYSQLSSINNESLNILSSMSSLTNEVALKLKDTLNSTIGSLDDKVQEIDGTVDELKSTARGVIDQASDLVDMVVGYVNDGKSYDQSRAKGLMALFVVTVIVMLVIIVAFLMKVKFIFNIIAGLSFIFLFLFWLSGSIHFMLGMVLYDACPIIDVTVQGMLPQGSQAATVLQGCLYEQRTVLDSMNITAYNLTDVFDYKSQFESFADFSNEFNFSAIDSYFDSISSLYKYNLTDVANNLTLESYGWNETYVYTALDFLNNQTYPDYFDLSNYTSANPDNYTVPQNQTVYEAKETLTNLIVLNATLHNKTDTAKAQMYAAQASIDVLIVKMNNLQAKFAEIKDVVQTLQIQNISNCIDILDNLQANITGFFELGNCSFLGESYIEIRDGLCDTMQPAIDCLTVGQFLAGLALIPMLIIAEVLSFRYPKSIFRNPFSCDNSDDWDEESAKKKSKNDYAVAMTDSVPKRSGITATIGTGPPSTDSSPAGTPDFNDSRRRSELPPLLGKNRITPLAL